MALVDSLLTAMVRANGDALVMHVGEKPIVVAGSRTIDLSGHGLPLGAMVGMLGQLLPAEARAALEEFGAVEHRLPDRGDDRFSVVAARGGDDIWIEIRRRRQAPTPAAETAPVEVPPPAEADVPGPPAPDTRDEARSPAEPDGRDTVTVDATDTATVETQPGVPGADDAQVAASAEPIAPAAAAGDVADVHPGETEPVVVETAATEEPVEVVGAAAPGAPVPELVVPVDAPRPETPVSEAAPEPLPTMVEVVAVEAAEAEAVATEVVAAEVADAGAEAPPAAVADEVAEAAAEAVAQAVSEAVPEAEAAADTGVERGVESTVPVAMLASAGVVATLAARPVPQVPMDITSPHGPSSGGGGLPPIEPPAPVAASSFEAAAAGAPDQPPVLRTVRIEVPPRAGSPRAARVSRLLRTAADHGASELFLLSQARPTMRVDGSMRPLESEASVTAADVEAMLAEVTPEPWREAVGRGDPAEWLIELADIGRVRCVAFRDHRGPGANFHVLSLRPVSLDELGLGGDARLLASEADGLVVLASPGAEERARLVAAFVDGINRQRSDYVITIASRVSVQHEPRQALLSQREVGSSPERALTAVRAALRESPDVLVVEDVVAGEAAALLIEASAGGRLVMVAVPEASAAAAVGWLLAQVPESRRQSAAELAATTFRGALAQVPLRRTTGGRVAAREVLLGTAATARHLAGGGALPEPETGSLVEAAVGYVRAGVVDVREALRRVPGTARLREALVAAGVDTTPIDRLA